VPEGREVMAREKMTILRLTGSAGELDAVRCLRMHSLATRACRRGGRSGRWRSKKSRRGWTRELIFGVVWEVMNGKNLSTMSDRELVARLEELLRQERRLTAAVLMHLGEVEARQLYRPAACSSMHGYCTRVLGMSEDQAFKRIRAARVVRRFAVVEAAVEEGRLHLTGVVLLAPHLTADNVESLVAEASGKSKAEIEVLLARLAPKPDVPQRLDRVEGRKFGKSRAPRAAKVCSGARTVPREVRRQVVARDGLRCSFVSEDGRRCEETGFLELDHVVPVSRGGRASVDGIRILCASHNQYEAERILGREAVLAGRAARGIDDDLVAGLRRLGVTASDARQAVAATRGPGAVEERMRAALGALGAVYTARGAPPR
jgi:5-methylcytosine-specific restriction endonuclease McrA